MKALIIMQGAPGCGKTTWVKNNNLQDYCISERDLQSLYGINLPTITGRETVSTTMKHDQEIRKFTLKALRARLEQGAFTVLDGAYPGERAQRRAVALANQHGYKVFILNAQEDMTNEELLGRNKTRAEGAVTTEHLLKVAGAVRKEKNARGTELITPTTPLWDETFLGGLVPPVRRAEDYEKVIVVGDVQSCAEPLKELLENHGGLGNTRNLYVFAGDLFDRGPDALGVFETMRNHGDNVVLLEGNHEKNLRAVLTNNNDGKYKSSIVSRDQILAGGYYAKHMMELLGKTQPYQHITTNNGDVFVCHGGIMPDTAKDIITNPHEALLNIPDHLLTYGVGTLHFTQRRKTWYKEDVDALIASDDLLQIHGHRNGSKDEKRKHPTAIDGVINLEQGVDKKNGYLAAAVLECGEWRIEKYEQK